MAIGKRGLNESLCLNETKLNNNSYNFPFSVFLFNLTGNHYYSKIQKSIKLKWLSGSETNKKTKQKLAIKIQLNWEKKKKKVELPIYSNIQGTHDLVK